MKLNQKISLIASILLFFTMPILSIRSVDDSFIQVVEGLDTISITSQEMTLIVNDYKSHRLLHTGRKICLKSKQPYLVLKPIDI